MDDSMAEQSLRPAHQPTRTQRLKRCHQCGREFARAEHLQRHQRIHTRETPFSCPHCQQTFQRSDVQHRHVTKHCSRRLLASSDPQDQERSFRARVACSSCHQKKLKCNGYCPCSACEKGNRECTYRGGRTAASSVRRRPSMLSQASNPQLDQLEALAPSSDIIAPAAERQSCGDGRDVQPAMTIVGEELQKSDPPLQLERGENREASPHRSLIPTNDPSSVCSRLAPEPPFAVDTMGTFSSPSAVPISASLEPLFQVGQIVLQPEHADQTLALEPGIQDMVSASDMQQLPLDQDEWITTFFDNIQGFDASFTGRTPLNFTPMFHDAGTFSLDILSDDEVNAICWGSLESQAAFSDSAPAALSKLQEHSRFSRASSPHSRQDATRWLLTSPSLQKFDRDIINCFLSNFMRHIAPTFTSFIGFKVDAGTTADKILAMAAVGGLFCTTNGSFSLARAMCSDARRMVSVYSYGNLPEPEELQISVIQTHTLVELFGICSGDKRLYECGEAFHLQMLQLVSQCQFLTPPSSGPSSETWIRLTDDLYMLECYRVVLFQRPPNLYPTSTPTLYSPWEAHGSLLTNDSNNHRLLHTLRALMTPEGPTVAFENASQAGYTLAALLIFSWHAMPIKLAFVGDRGPWERSHFELGLNRWLKSHKGHIEDSTMLLFHLASIALHTNMASLHGLVHNVLQPSDQPINVTDAIKQWHNSDHSKIAVWHAGCLTQAAKRIVVSQRLMHSKMSTPANSGEENSKAPEPPHAAICMYLATLTLWASEVASEPVNVPIAKAALERGCSILSQFNVRIATLLENILRLLEEKM